MKTFEEIDVKSPLSVEDFCTLFDQLPLNEVEKISVKDEYFKMYTTFIQADVKPESSWIAIRNIFIVKNQDIANRVQKS